ncbi:MAG: hypothetical protein ACFFEY_17295 [Candidatus Thorarchaeota archaeon]
MTESIYMSIFKKTTIAEINSLKLFDYESSLNNYFEENNHSKFDQGYFKLYDNGLPQEIQNSLLKEYEEWFCKYFF